MVQTWLPKSLGARTYPFPLTMAVRASTASREPINQLIKCALDSLRAWGRCASPLLSSVMFRSSKSRLRHCKPGRKKYQAAEIGGRASSDRAVGSIKKLWAPAVPGPTRFLRRAPFLDDRVDAFGPQDGDAAEEKNLILLGQAK